MHAKFRENQRKTVGGVAIWRLTDRDKHTTITDRL